MKYFGGVGTKLSCTHHPWIIVMAHIFSSMCAQRSKQDTDEWMNGWMDDHCGMGLHPLKLIVKVQTHNNFK
jgi:hypothetical protein